MAEPGLLERLQPALLDRLTDDEPDKALESREMRVVTLTKLRASVLRDLTWLLNTVRLEAAQDLSEYPLVQQSVLNYGLPSFAGSSLDLIGISGAEQAVRDAILRYEPRLTSKTLTVRVAEDFGRDSHNTVAFEIEAQLWAQPLPQQVFLKTELDLELGAVRVTEQAERPRPQSRRR